jgi:hypothetical protein
VLLSGDGTLKIADFGLAIDLNQERAVTRAGEQTPALAVNCAGSELTSHSVCTLLFAFLNCQS